MKYCMFIEEEFFLLEKDLIVFLIVNGLDGEVWEKLNCECLEDVVKVVVLFFDVVL